MQNRISSEGKRTWSREARFQDRFRIGAGACYITSEPQAALSKLCIRIIHLSAQCKRLMTADTGDRYESVGRLFEVGTLVYLFVEMMGLSC
jgi:hypothetical protein